MCVMYVGQSTTFKRRFSNFSMWVLNIEHRSHFFSCTMLAKLSMMSLCVSVFFLPVLCLLFSGGCSKVLPWWLKTVLSTLEAGHLRMKIMMSSNLYHFWCSKAGSVSCLFQLLTAADTLLLIASFQSVFQWLYHLPFCGWHKPIWILSLPFFFPTPLILSFRNACFSTLLELVLNSWT